MINSLNKVTLIGNVGDDPKIVELNNNNNSSSKKLASFSLATSHNWMDSKTGERKSNTDWHRIAIYGENLIRIVEKTGIKKGTKLFIEGKLVNRKWVDQSGQNRTTTEIILQGYDCKLIVLSEKDGKNNQFEQFDKHTEEGNDPW